MGKTHNLISLQVVTQLATQPPHLFSNGTTFLCMDIGPHPEVFTHFYCLLS